MCRLGSGRIRSSQVWRSTMLEIAWVCLGVLEGKFSGCAVDASAVQNARNYFAKRTQIMEGKGAAKSMPECSERVVYLR